MSKAAMISKASRAFNKVGFTLKKRSPEILAVAGTVGVITSGVMACKATTKVSKIIEERNEQLEQVHDYVDENGFTAEYTEDDNRKDIAIIHTQTGFKMVKLYAPAVAIGALSLAALLGSNQILRKRNVALGAAYTALDRSFKKYRNAVIDRFGEELDKELKYGLKAEKVENEIVDENGKKKKVKEKKQEQITEKQENALLKFVKEKGISGVINILKQISKLATDTLKDLFKRITVTEFTLNVQVAGEDAADTAIKYGYCCSVIFPAVSAILSVVKYKERNVKIVPDFSDNPETKIDGKVIARIRICSLLCFAVTKLGKILKLLINYKIKWS